MKIVPALGDQRSAQEADAPVGPLVLGGLEERRVVDGHLRLSHRLSGLAGISKASR